MKLLYFRAESYTARYVSYECWDDLTHWNGGGEYLSFITFGWLEFNGAFNTCRSLCSSLSTSVVSSSDLDAMTVGDSFLQQCDSMRVRFDDGWSCTVSDWRRCMIRVSRVTRRRKYLWTTLLLFATSRSEGGRRWQLEAGRQMTATNRGQLRSRSCDTTFAAAAADAAKRSFGRRTSSASHRDIADLCITRPLRMHSVHKMRPIATYGVVWSVCVWMSVDLVCEPCKTAEPIEMQFGGWLAWRKQTCVRWGPDPQGEGQFRVVRAVEKHWESLLRCT